MASFYYYCPCKVRQIGLGFQEGNAAYFHWPIEDKKCKYCGESLKQVDTSLVMAILSVKGGKNVMEKLVKMGREESESNAS